MKRTIFCLALVSTIGLGVESGEAGTAIATEATLRVYCSDKNGTSHPKSTQLQHFVTTDTFEHAGPKLLLVSYESNQCCLGVTGVIKGTVRGEGPDGARTSYGNLTIRTDPRVVAGQALKSIDDRFPRGSSFEIDLRFNKFRTLAKDSCFNVTTALSSQ